MYPVYSLLHVITNIVQYVQYGVIRDFVLYCIVLSTVKQKKPYAWDSGILILRYFKIDYISVYISDVLCSILLYTATILIKEVHTKYALQPEVC